MKMDTLYWNQISPEIRLLATKKRFYGQFNWRLRIYVEGGRSLESGNKTIAESIKQRHQLANVFGKNNTWYRSVDFSKISVEFLTRIKFIKTNLGNKIRMRIEEPFIQIYANSEQMLKDIAVDLDKNDSILEVTGPQDAAAEQILMTDSILVTSPPEYEYKVLLREGRYSIDTKTRVLDYLLRVGDDVKLSDGSRRMLQKDYSSMWGVFFYTHDPALITFIRLIDPNIVWKIYKLVYLPK